MNGEHHRHWIQSAGDRLERAETHDPGEDTTLSCEDAQQVAELALKGLIVTHGQEPKRTHDLGHLLRQIEQLGERSFITIGVPRPDDGRARLDAALRHASDHRHEEGQ